MRSWLTIDGNNGNFYYFVDDNENRISIRPIDLSFTEYAIQGFSQERPVELPEVGEVCLFSDDEYSWYIRDFKERGVPSYPFRVKGSGAFKYCKRVKFL